MQLTLLVRAQSIIMTIQNYCLHVTTATKPKRILSSAYLQHFYNIACDSDMKHLVQGAELLAGLTGIPGAASPGDGPALLSCAKTAGGMAPELTPATTAMDANPEAAAHPAAEAIQLEGHTKQVCIASVHACLLLTAFVTHSKTACSAV